MSETRIRFSCDGREHRCGHNFTPHKCPYEACGFREAEAERDELRRQVEILRKDNEVLREVFDVNARAFSKINEQQIEMAKLRRDLPARLARAIAEQGIPDDEAVIERIIRDAMNGGAQ